MHAPAIAKPDPRRDWPWVLAAALAGYGAALGVRLLDLPKWAGAAYLVEGEHIIDRKSVV